MDIRKRGTYHSRFFCFSLPTQIDIPLKSNQILTKSPLSAIFLPLNIDF